MADSAILTGIQHHFDWPTSSQNGLSPLAIGPKHQADIFAKHGLKTESPIDSILVGNNKEIYNCSLAQPSLNPEPDLAT